MPPVALNVPSPWMQPSVFGSSASFVSRMTTLTRLPSDVDVVFDAA
jgi:hypothetical protein